MKAFQVARTKVEEIADISGVVGMSYTVIDHGETIVQESIGYRDAEAQKPATADTVYHIASLTKSFTGACIDHLRTQGKLSYEDLVAAHLPEATHEDPYLAKTLTIADLLGHRTGLQKADEIWLGGEGEILIHKNQTAAIFRQLQLRSQPRSKFSYNNFCYAILGDVIEKISGKPYHVFLKETLLDPLGMSRTLVTKEGHVLENVTEAYNSLENGHPFRVPQIETSADGPMGAALGLMSTTGDLAMYAKSLMRSWQIDNQLRSRSASSVPASSRDVIWMFAPLQIMELPTSREKSYAAGWARSQLPTAINDMGINIGLVKSMPLLGRGTGSRLAIWHHGSLVGTLSFIMLLPETESAVIVLTNTLTCNDAADWIGELLVETLLQTPFPHDYRQLTLDTMERSKQKYAELALQIEQGRHKNGPGRDIADYTGSYIGLRGIFSLVVAQVDNHLEVLFQGRQSQRYQLEHHHADTFTWFPTWDEQAKRARFPSYAFGLYFMHFQTGDDKMIGGLNWQFDSAIPAGHEFVKTPDSSANWGSTVGTDGKLTAAPQG